MNGEDCLNCLMERFVTEELPQWFGNDYIEGAFKRRVKEGSEKYYLKKQFVVYKEKTESEEEW